LVLHGARQKVGKGGIASASVISSGGREVASAGGLVVDATIFSGGVLIVSSGATVTGGVNVVAGSAIIDGTMAAGQTVSFAGSAGTLQLDNLSAFGAAISGLGGAFEKIDIGGFAFGPSETVAWSQAGTSGTLTLNNGATSGSLTLVGTYATSDFRLFTDGRGGTLVKDPSATPNAAPATTHFTQAAASLESGRGAALATVHGGGTALLGASPPLITATSGR
jgi:autotransporter passenger strand-loop-strand repeat protein